MKDPIVLVKKELVPAAEWTKEMRQELPGVKIYKVWLQLTPTGKPTFDVVAYAVDVKDIDKMIWQRSGGPWIGIRCLDHLENLLYPDGYILHDLQKHDTALPLVEIHDESSPCGLMGLYDLPDPEDFPLPNFVQTVSRVTKSIFSTEVYVAEAPNGPLLDRVIREQRGSESTPVILHSIFQTSYRIIGKNREGLYGNEVSLYPSPDNYQKVPLDSLPLTKGTREDIVELETSIADFRVYMHQMLKKHTVRNKDIAEHIKTLPADEGPIHIASFAGEHHPELFIGTRAALLERDPDSWKQINVGIGERANTTHHSIYTEKAWRQAEDYAFKQRSAALKLYHKIAKAILKAWDKSQQEEKEVQHHIEVINKSRINTTTSMSAPNFMWSMVNNFIKAPILVYDPETQSHRVSHPAITVGHSIPELQLHLPLEEGHHIMLEIAQRMGAFLQLHNKVGTPRTLKLIFALFWIYQKEQESRGFSLVPGEYITVSLKEIAKTVQPEFARNANGKDRTEFKEFFYLASKFLQHVEIFNTETDSKGRTKKIFDNDRIPTRIDGLFKFAGDRGQKESMEEIIYGLNPIIHKMQYGQSQDVISAVHNAEILMKRNPRNQGNLIIQQIVAEQLIRVCWSHQPDERKGEIATRRGEPYSLQNLLARTGISSLPDYKKNKNRVLHRFLRDWEQLVKDDVIGHFEVVGSGQPEERSVVIKASAKTIEYYRAMDEASVSKRALRKIDANHAQRQHKQKALA